MQGLLATLIVVGMVVWVKGNHLQPKAIPPNIIDVIQYGAIGNGVADDSQAFLEAWGAACGGSSNDPLMYIPAGKTFLLGPLKFQGPCRSPIVTVMVMGDIVAPTDIKAWIGHDLRTWIVFGNVNGLTVEGNGKIDGHGGVWWPQADKLVQRPSALAFEKCNDLKMVGLTHVNSPGSHIQVSGCNGVTMSNLNITAPASSPNTDGIDIGQSINVHILHSNIATASEAWETMEEQTPWNKYMYGTAPFKGLQMESGSKLGREDQDMQGIYTLKESSLRQLPTLSLLISIIVFADPFARTRHQQLKNAVAALAGQYKRVGYVMLRTSISGKERRRTHAAEMGRWSESPDVEKGRRTSGPPPPPPHFSAPTPEPWFSWIVPVIFLANIFMFVYSMYINNCPSKTGKDHCILYDPFKRFSFQPFHENPLLGPSTDTLRKMGALEKRLVVHENEAWRLLTCMWLHAGVIHLVTNMLSLIFIGIRLEQEFGFFRIGVLYVLSGFGGSLMSCLNLHLSDKPTISVGASGALFGLLGAMLSELITNWTIYANKCAALLTLIVIIAINLSFGFLPHVDNSAHIGGFISGFLLGFILLVRPQFGYVSRKYIPTGYDIKRKSKYKCYQYVLWVTALVLLIFFYAYCWLKLHE
ncbi:hypothetical protein FNV43_RR06963 [Rhamnella rubrinervis]|uniref:RHOMBOID-like protein n=1 Tax=Rhamnella rubrinervis TaxID=2594499 RepID=A0A8K0MLX4_9ROSA|nr:hypothetical protein FNV43_RR06963 [Rhamnella rubrinervis]